MGIRRTLFAFTIPLISRDILLGLAGPDGWNPRYALMLRSCLARNVSTRRALSRNYSQCPSIQQPVLPPVQNQIHVYLSLAYPLIQASIPTTVITTRRRWSSHNRYTNSWSGSRAYYSQFSFQVGQAFCAKHNGTQRPQGPGQDALFAEKWKSGSIALGVADGVGGWTNAGIDPAKFSSELCRRMAQRFKQRESELEDDDHASSNNDKELRHHDMEKLFKAAPRLLLKHAFESIAAEGDTYAGGSTACVGIARAENGELDVANLGDSGYMIFRKGRLYRRSEPQIHQFNTPYQLAIVPERMRGSNGRRRITDMPSDAEITHHQLEHGDVVVFFTDGLSDNLFAQDILKIVNSTMLAKKCWKHKDTQIVCGSQVDNCQAETVISRTLVRSALTASIDPNGLRPFSYKLRQEMGLLVSGGKPDDITVLVMIVQQQPDSDGPEAP